MEPNDLAVSLDIDSDGRVIVAVAAADDLTLIAVTVLSMDETLQLVWSVSNGAFHSDYSYDFATTTIDAWSVGTPTGPMDDPSLTNLPNLAPLHIDSVKQGGLMTVCVGAVPDGMTQMFPREQLPPALMPDREYVIRLLLARGNQIIDCVRIIKIPADDER